MNSFPSTLTPKSVKYYYELHIYISLKELRENIYRKMLRLDWIYDFNPFFKKHNIIFKPLQIRIIDQMKKELRKLNWMIENQKDYIYKIKPFRYTQRNYYYPYRNSTKPIITDFNYKMSQKELESIELTSSFLV